MSWSRLKYGKILQHWLNVGPTLCYQLTSAIEWECVRWTSAQHWANVVYPTPTGQPLSNIGLTLGQRCLPNANGPTITQRWPNVCMLSGVLFRDKTRNYMKMFSGRLYYLCISNNKNVEFQISSRITYFTL